MRRLRLLALLALCALVGWPPRALHAQAGAPVQIGAATFSSVAEWQSGTPSSLLVTNNSGGELRLAAGATRGVFDSGLIPTNFTAQAVGAVWRANVPQGTQLTIEVRGGPSGDALGDWQPITASDSRSKSDDGAFALEAALPLAADTSFLQLRMTLVSTVTNASPEVSELTLSYLNAMTGITQVSALERVPAIAGAATLTPAPRLVARSAWSGNAPSPARVERATPRGIVIHQIGSDAVDNPLPFLRAQLNYQTKTLGWDDLPYHYIIDRDGTLYEGRAGGPTSSVGRLSGGDTAIHVAVIGSGAPAGAVLVTLQGLLAWLGQAYNIAPLGTHSVTPPEGAASTRPNIVAHSEIVPDAGDPSGVLRDQVAAIRQASDTATVRSRWYFAEGNPQNYAERLAVLNPTKSAAGVRFILLRQPGPAVIRETSVPAGGRADLVINELFNDTADVPAIVESNAPVIAERFMDFETEFSQSVGVSKASRVWYFAEGSTDGTNRTFLVLFNPQSTEAQATVTYIRDNGIAAEQRVSVPPLQRRVVVVGDTLSGARFGARVIASQPIVAERTMIFGAGSTLDTGGVHTTPGVTTLSRRWYFAEGTTETPFQMNVLVLNPNAQPVDVAVTFMTPDGTSLTRRYAVPPTTRLAINVNEVVPQLGVATTVSADRPVAAERSISWNNGLAGTAGPGATTPAYTWRFADGRTSEGFQEYLLLSNPGKNQARVTVSYTLANGTVVSDAAITMPGGSRQTIAVHGAHGGQSAIAATVQSTQPLVAERSMYRGDPRSTASTGGETVLGVAGDLP
jgi:hypothetical protein